MKNTSKPEILRELQGDGKTNVVFGASYCGRALVELAGDFGISITAFCDNSPQKIGQRINGLPVLRPEEAHEQYGNVNFIIGLYSPHHIEQGLEQLRQMGVLAIYDAQFLAGLPSTEDRTRDDAWQLANDLVNSHKLFEPGTGEKFYKVGRETTAAPYLLALVKKKSDENAGLNGFAKRAYSYSPSEGITKEIFSRIEEKWNAGYRGECIEFGAWDGKYDSSTFDLIKNHGWNGLMIESDPIKYTRLLETAREVDGRIDAVNGCVGFDKHPTLDDYVKKHPIQADLLSIDVDGFDYHIWDSLQTIRPRVVIIEFNVHVPVDVVFCQAKDESVNEGASAAALVELARRKKYSLAAVHECNLFFVTDEEFPKLNLDDNSLERLWQPPYSGRVLQGLNGKVYTLGMYDFSGDEVIHDSGVVNVNRTV